MKKQELEALVVELLGKIDRLTTSEKLPEKRTIEAIEELIESKKRSNRRTIYISSLNYCLRRFAVNHPKLSDITTESVEKWLAGFKGLYTRSTWLTRISTLCSFAMRRSWIRENPCDKVERISIDRNPPAVCTVEQARDLVLTCPPKLLAYLALGMFAGVRPDEILRTKWSQFNIELHTIEIEGKTRRRRLVPLEPVAFSMLCRCPRFSENVSPSRETVRRWKRGMGRAVLGGKWPADILRHTAASFLLAKYQDAGKVAFWLGNSAKILLTHYHRPISKADCEKFWSPKHYVTQ